MSDDLVRLVQSEKRGADALISMLVVLFLSAGIAVSRFFTIMGYPFFVATGLVVMLWWKKRRALVRLLHGRNEIETVERIRWLGRPALRVLFFGGSEVTLPTWNSDRERVVSLLEKRELPPAKLLR